MKRFIPYSAAWLLVLCLMAVNTTPLVFPTDIGSWVCVKIDVHNDSYPADGKEEKNETLKFARHLVAIDHLWFIEVSLHFIEQPHQKVRDIYLPIILPPPKVSA